MVEIPLSQFVLRSKIACTFKYSKGCKKRVRINNEDFIGDTLTLLIDPFLDCDMYQFSARKNGKLVFTQSPRGNIRINVSLDITVSGTNDEPNDNYIEVCRARQKNKGVQRDTFFIPLEIQN